MCAGSRPNLPGSSPGNQAMRRAPQGILAGFTGSAAPGMPALGSLAISKSNSGKLAWVSTIHVFCWSLIRAFQPALRQGVQTLEEWKERLADGAPITKQLVEYELGYRRLTEETISLHHDDVLALTANLLAMPKFQAIVAGRFPYILIDEYQDTSAVLMSAIREHLLGRKSGPLIGLFGDHWQRIYDETCGQNS